MSYKIDVINVEWKKVSEKELSKTIFNDENVNKSLIHEFVVMQLANARQNLAHVKTRWEVVSSWKKLFRQKWTWRARAWDAASPIRRSGWQTFWPRNNRNYSKDMNKKARKKALFWSLSLKLKSWDILALESYTSDEISTKFANTVINNIKLSDEKVLLVVSRWDDVVIKSFRNLPNVNYVYYDYLNPKDLLTHNKVLFLLSSLESFEDLNS